MSQATIRHDKGTSKTTQKLRHSWSRASRLDFPHFNGEDFDGWILKAQYYFEVDETLTSDRIKIAMLHLDGQAMQ